MPTSKREILAKGFYYSGLCSLIEPLVCRHVLLVVNYHRLGVPSLNPYDDGVFDATPRQFEKQMHHLRKHFHIMSLDELAAAARAEFFINEPCAMVTFDDGYVDNYELALPILNRYRIPAVFFIPANNIENPRLPWWDCIAYIIKRTSKKRFTLECNGPLQVSFDNLSSNQAIKAVLSYFKQAKEMNESLFISHLQERCNVEVDMAALGGDLFMSWAQLQEAANAGIGIGSHTSSHQILGRLSEAEQLEELAGSKRTLERGLNRTVIAVSYPVGGTNAFTVRTKQLAHEAGYQLGFSYYGGVNKSKQIDAFDVKRVGVEMHQSHALFCSCASINAILDRRSNS